MATLATYFKKDEAVIYREDEEAAPAPRAIAHTLADPYRLRTLPNEDVYFFCKRIDNSRLLKEKDPRAPRECWSAIGAFALLAILVTAALAPTLWGTFAGYQLQSLKQERQRLVDERSMLEVEEAALVSPARLEKLARAQKLLEPAPGQVVHLEPRADGSMAMNLTK
jgi:cell division protein FtsL